MREVRKLKVESRKLTNLKQGKIAPQQSDFSFGTVFVTDSKKQKAYEKDRSSMDGMDADNRRDGMS